MLARLVHERVTPSFSPLRLGEIVAHRQFTVSGVLTKDGQFDRAPKRIPEPQKLQTFFDFLESVKLALLFAQRGPELHLNDWVGWCHPTMYPHVRELYVRSSWSLCMKTRRGPRSRWPTKRSSPVRACPRPSPGTFRPTPRARATKQVRATAKARLRAHTLRQEQQDPSYKPGGGSANTGQGSSSAQCHPRPQSPLRCGPLPAAFPRVPKVSAPGLGFRIKEPKERRSLGQSRSRARCKTRDSPFRVSAERILFGPTGRQACRETDVRVLLGFWSSGTSLAEAFVPQTALQFVSGG